MYIDINVVVLVCLVVKLNIDCLMVYIFGGGVVGMGDGFSLSFFLNFESRFVILVSVIFFVVFFSFLRKVSFFSVFVLILEKEFFIVFVFIE